MPFYFYAHTCGYEAFLQRSVKDYLMPCPNCKTELRPVINKHTVPNIMLSSVTNHIYNNGMGQYDVGLGTEISSRQEHRRIMEEKGVVESDYKSAEEFIEVSEKAADRDPDISIDHIKDRYEYYKAEVDKGRTRNDENVKFTDGVIPIGGDDDS